MIITKTPFRIPIGGGGTDLPKFYSKHGGYIFSVTLDKYLYTTIHNPVIDDKYRVYLPDGGEYTNIEEVQNAYVKEVLKYFNVQSLPLTITTSSDFPGGTGLGSSGSFLVGLIRAVSTLFNIEYTKQEIAEIACEIEMQKLNRPVGKHDQYCASLGGFVELVIDNGGKVNILKPKITQEVEEELVRGCKLFYTHTLHKTEEILKSQNDQAGISESQVEKSLLEIKEIGMQIKSEFEQGNVKNFGKLMDQHWEVKKKMSDKISSPYFDEIYSAAKSIGVEGGKIMGAGGGGLFLFYCPKHPEVLTKLLSTKGLSPVDFRVNHGGSKVVFQE